MLRFLSAAVLFAGGALQAAMLPGFTAEKVASLTPFASSIATDSRGTLYYTTTGGGIYRLDGAQSTLVAQVTTRGIGNAGLLGIALESDQSAIVHYTTPEITHEVISRIDLVAGAETVITRIICNADDPAAGVNSEHHGGNPAIGDDGSIYVGIGDFAAFWTVPKPEWSSGKVFRIKQDGTVQQLASGFRNPFDLVWDRQKQRLIVPDNGDGQDDEINIITTGGFYGWPYTMGDQPPVSNGVPPIYTFPEIIAPTGIVALSGKNSILRRGYLLGGFVPKAIFLIPDIDARPLPDPIALIDHETGPVVDVTESANGEIYFTTGSALYRLRVPQRGDCNGDGLVDFGDLGALEGELADGDPHPMVTAQSGLVRSSWGCDVNADTVISSADRPALVRMFSNRARAVRH